MSRRQSNTEGPNVFIVYVPGCSAWWTMFGVIGNNPGTWDYCDIVADDGTNKGTFQSLEDFTDWNTANRKNPMTLGEKIGPYLYILA